MDFRHRHRCACAIFFILGITFSTFLNYFLNSSQPFISSKCDIYDSLASMDYNLKQPNHKLLMKEYGNPSFYSNTPTSAESPVLEEQPPESSTQILNINPYQKSFSSASETYPTGSNLKVLCWILTQPKNHQKKAANVKATWAKRCDQFLYMSTEYDATLPTTVIKGAKEGRNGLWSKTRGAFKIIYDKYLHKADFFLKADDDTFVLVDNLKYMLKDYNSSVPNIFGCWFELGNKKKNTSTKWMSGGAGYVLSRAAVKALVEKGYKNSKCKRSMEGGAEDMNIAQCLNAANVTFIDTRDKFGRYTFHGYPAKTHLNKGALPKWWHQYIKFPQKSGMDCCSEDAVSFHYIPPQDMFTYEYLLYHLRPRSTLRK